MLFMLSVRQTQLQLSVVKCSRAKSLAGLRMLGGISKHALAADPKVVAFYKSMQRSAY